MQGVSAIVHHRHHPVHHTTMSMSFAQTYILALRVRLKLTRDASAPHTPLSRLVVQANMLDNLMDTIAEAQAAREDTPAVTHETKTVVFDAQPPSRDHTEILTYEIESDDDDEDDDIYYTSSDYDSESDEELSDDGDLASDELTRMLSAASDYHYPYSARSGSMLVDALGTVHEEDENEVASELPLLVRCHSSSDSEEELAEVLYDVAAPANPKEPTREILGNARCNVLHHHRSNAIHLITNVF